MKRIKAYYRSIQQRDPSLKSFSEFLLYPSVYAIGFYRIAHIFYNKKLYFFARFLSQVARSFTGIEIHPGAHIGKNLFIDHGMGVVIGETAIVGDNVTMFHSSTLGGITSEATKRHPTIEDNVIIGAGAKILGDITIGKGSKIGANSVVLRSIPQDTTAVGIPAQVKKKKIPCLNIQDYKNRRSS